MVGTTSVCIDNAVQHVFGMRVMSKQ